MGFGSVKLKCPKVSSRHYSSTTAITNYKIFMSTAAAAERVEGRMEGGTNGGRISVMDGGREE